MSLIREKYTCQENWMWGIKFFRRYKPIYTVGRILSLVIQCVLIFEKHVLSIISLQNFVTILLDLSSNNETKWAKQRNYLKITSFFTDQRIIVLSLYSTLPHQIALQYAQGPIESCYQNWQYWYSLDRPATKNLVLWLPKQIYQWNLFSIISTN